MTDIVERLRKAYGPDHTGETPVETLPLEAADEIDRLRDLFRMDGKQHANHIKSLTKSHEARISKYAKEFERLRRERDEARAAALEEAVNLAIGLDLLKYEIDAFRELRDRAP